MEDKINIEKLIGQIEEALPVNNVVARARLKKLKAHIYELEYLIGDLIEGCEVDEFNARAEELLSTDEICEEDKNV